MVENAHLPPLLNGQAHERLKVYRLSRPGHGPMAPSALGAARRLIGKSAHIDSTVPRLLKGATESFLYRSKVAGGNRVPT
jgi:hypothetical protein